MEITLHKILITMFYTNMVQVTINYLIRLQNYEAMYIWIRHIQLLYIIDSIIIIKLYCDTSIEEKDRGRRSRPGNVMKYSGLEISHPAWFGIVTIRGTHPKSTPRLNVTNLVCPRLYFQLYNHFLNFTFRSKIEYRLDV